jgi:hypothetical protein
MHASMLKGTSRKTFPVVEQLSFNVGDVLTNSSADFSMTMAAATAWPFSPCISCTIPTDNPS